MKVFDEADIIKLVKSQKMTMEEFTKTKDKELSIEEKSLEVEVRTAKALEDICNLLRVNTNKKTA